MTDLYTLTIHTRVNEKFVGVEATYSDLFLFESPDGALECHTLPHRPEADAWDFGDTLKALGWRLCLPLAEGPAGTRLSLVARTKPRWTVHNEGYLFAVRDEWTRKDVALVNTRTRAHNVVTGLLSGTMEVDEYGWARSI
jgi:hypothetical protein